ncbi:T9SS type A sorting domain-containing protein [Flavobacterium sp. RHBU_3]|uniref:pectate lyase family protein n=1 Tax=Flavobacterium sp. RHBU_3 TaxID=3391184 RepID=UPI003984E9A9
MKKSIFLFIFGLSIWGASAQTNFSAVPEGFGANTTGGGSVAAETVTTFADLKAKLTSSTAKVILVSGEITVPSGQPISAVVTNKTLIGLPGAKLINETQSNPGSGILYLKPGSNNVIIRNLIFVGPGAYDIDGNDNLTADGCTNLWVDHCEFQDGQDGNFDLKGLTDNVTVSWCKFTYLKPAVCCGSGGSNDHRFSDLVGSSASNAPADGHYSITFQGCYWADGCKERMPRARNAELHILNCYYNTSVSGSRALGLGGGINNTTCYVENTNFASISNVYANYNSTDGGTVAVNFTGCLNQGSAVNVGTVTAPSYTATVIPAEDVADAVTNTGCGAGATLNVNSSGEISVGICAATAGTENIKANNSIYPVVTNDSLKIYFGNRNPETADIELFSTNGQKVLSFKKASVSGSVFTADISSLAAGTYICKVKAGEVITNLRILKK